VYNGGVDRRPEQIVRCTGTADVLAALRFARQRRLPLAVKGSGHSAAGFGVCDGGVVIDLTAMNGVHVDPVRRVARARAGATWGEFDHETQAFGLATTGARISTTGVAGVTLGGGYGWLMRKFGLAVDNLISADVVAADGQLLRASASENPDLFWGLRGGGGNLGIATTLEFRIHSVGPELTGGMACYPVDRVRDVLSSYRELMSSAPDELSALCNVLALPEAPFVPPELRGLKVVAVAVAHVGPQEQARADLAPLFRELGCPLLDRIRPMPYTRLQRLYDAAGAFGRRVYGRSGHLASLDDGVLDLLARYAPGVASPHSVVMISALGGAVARVGEQDTAFSRRRTAFDCSINAVWDEGDRRPHHRWVDEFWAALRPFAEGVYVNELGDEGAGRVREAYSPETYRRLGALKRVYDPENVFRLNHNIDARE